MIIFLTVLYLMISAGCAYEGMQTGPYFKNKVAEVVASIVVGLLWPVILGSAIGKASK